MKEGSRSGGENRRIPDEGSRTRNAKTVRVSCTADTLMRIVRDFLEVASCSMERVDEPHAS